MANPFSINVVTPAGAALIAQATATNQIVFIGAKSATVAATDAEDLAGKDLSFYDGADGTIDACSATNNVAKIVSRFGNTSGAAQIVKSVCILGRLANQTDAQAVIVAAMSDDASEIYLPSSASPTQIIRIPFNNTINAGEDVETAYADGATIADLSRFVSMYKAGDPTQGEDQQIKGVKEFNGEVIFDDEATFGNRVTFDDEASFSTATFNNTADFQNGFTLTDGDTGSITVSVTRSTRTDAYITFPSGETGHLHVLNTTVDCYGDITAEGSLHADGDITSYGKGAFDYGLTICNAVSNGKVTVDDSTGAVAIQNNLSVGGMFSVDYSPGSPKIYADNIAFSILTPLGMHLFSVTFSNGDVNSSGNINTSGNINASGNISASGNINASGNISASGTGAFDGNVSVGGLSGTDPIYNSSTGLSIPIGGIIVAYLPTGRAGASVILRTGEILDVDAVYSAAIDKPSTVNLSVDASTKAITAVKTTNSVQLPSGSKWRCLCDVYSATSPNPSDPASETVAVLMRIE